MNNLNQWAFKWKIKEKKIKVLCYFLNNFNNFHKDIYTHGYNKKSLE